MSLYAKYLSSGAGGSGSSITLAAFDSQSPTAQGLALVGTLLSAQSADATHPGMVNTSTQTFAGNKTFTGSLSASNLSGTNTGDVTIGTANGLSVSGQALSLALATSSTPGAVRNIGSALGVATLDASGLIPVTQIPPAALERLVIVADQAARFALTTATVQNGDTVLQNDTSVMYFVKDDTNLNNPAGYAVYASGTAASVAWGGITSIPAPVSALLGTNTGDITLTAVGAAPSANGATLSGQALTLQPADATHPGLMTTGAQTFAGVKTFSSTIVGSVSGNAATVTTNANLTGVITSVGNATSIASQTGTGTTFAMSVSPVFTTPNIGTATGSASLNVLKAGDTMTGPLVMPAGSVSATSINGGTAGTGITFPSSTTLALNSTGAEVMRVTGNGILINTSTLDSTHAVHVKAPSGQTGIFSMESTGGSVYDWTLSGNQLALNLPASSWMPFTAVGSTQSVGLSTTNSNPQYPIEFNTSSANTSAGSITNGSTDYGIIGIRNKNTTVNNQTGIVFAGSSIKPGSMILSTNQNQTSGQETTKLDLRTANAGTLSTGLTVNAAGTITLPQYTTAGAIVNDGSGNLTSVAPSTSGNVLTSNGTAWVSSPGLTNPMTTLGDIIYENATPQPTRLAGNTSATIKFLSQTGTGSVSAAPAWTAFTAPTIQKFTATGTTTGWLFTISTSSTVAVGDTYTDSTPHTYTVLGALTAQSGQVLYMSGASTPTGSTLTRATGAGTASISFTAQTALATYTTPTSPAPLYIKVRMAGGGGGGRGAGTTGQGNGGNGAASTFGTSLLSAGAGAGATDASGFGGSGGASSLGTGPVGFAITGGGGGPGEGGQIATIGYIGGGGGSNALGGGGQAGAGGGSNVAGTNGATNTGGGGGGGGGNSANFQSGGGGGAGGYIEALIASPLSSYAYTVGTGGTAGAAGTLGNAGGAGAAGYIEITEHYQ